MFVIDQLQLLGLKKRELQVFVTLSTFGPQSVTRLGARSSLPRTTVDSILRRLERNGLLSKREKGKRWVWYIDHNEVTKKLSLLAEKISPAISSFGDSKLLERFPQEDLLPFIKRLMEDNQPQMVEHGCCNHAFGEGIDNELSELLKETAITYSSFPLSPNYSFGVIAFGKGAPMVIYDNSSLYVVERGLLHGMCDALLSVWRTY